MFNSYFKLRLKTVWIPVGFFSIEEVEIAAEVTKGIKTNPDDLLRRWFPSQPPTFITGQFGCISVKIYEI